MAVYEWYRIEAPTPVCGPKQHFHYHTTTIQPAIRGYSRTPFDSEESVRTIIPKLVMKGTQEVKSCGIDVTKVFARGSFRHRET